MYGKLMDGVLHRAPAPLVVEDREYYNPDHELYLQAGYFPVVETPYPEEGCYRARWEVQGVQIVRVWEETDPPVVRPTQEERLTALEAELAAAKILLGLEE